MSYTYGSLEIEMTTPKSKTRFQSGWGGIVIKSLHVGLKDHDGVEGPCGIHA